MDKAQKDKIIKLRDEGLSYNEISKRLGLSKNSVASVLRRDLEVEEPDRCECCGKELKQTPGHRQKRFCSERCRKKWWKANKPYIEIITKTMVCPCCGKVISYEEKVRRGGNNG